MPRVVIDTSLLVRMITGSPVSSPLYRLWREGRFELVLSPLLLEELEAVLNRPALQKYLRPGTARAFLELLSAEAMVVSPTIAVSLCRDPKDDALLEIAIAAQAEYLVSADQDLIGDPRLQEIMRAQYGVRIVTVTEFVKTLG
ncbi:MAG: putative toxin-antitoxin system toxin component, PIN family [Thermoflexales bacterium]|nr:putative toxin-antitoxin system toxin component, PIN family [Thermoflexales bacterium]